MKEFYFHFNSEEWECSNPLKLHSYLSIIFRFYSNSNFDFNYELNILENMIILILIPIYFNYILIPTTNQCPDNVLFCFFFFGENLIMLTCIRIGFPNDKMQILYHALQKFHFLNLYHLSCNGKSIVMSQQLDVLVICASFLLNSRIYLVWF